MTNDQDGPIRAASCNTTHLGALGTSAHGVASFSSMGAWLRMDPPGWPLRNRLGGNGMGACVKAGLTVRFERRKELATTGMEIYTAELPMPRMREKADGLPF